ncbi:hypothetical protein FJZ48_01825, partial [Candidatus Uhrbacteria bacterium]|nr:hypothetical protein [Candidatus Uhrbacteria bacterium]
MSKYIGITLALVAGLFGSTSSALAGVEEDKSAALAECGRLKELRTWADKDCTDDAQFKDDAAKAACEAKKAEALKLGDAAKLDELCKKVEVAAGACDNCDKDKKGAKGGVTAPGAKANEKSADPAV